MIGLLLVALLAGSRAAVDVVLPLVWAGLAACAAYPTYIKLTRRVPRVGAALIVLLLLLAIFAAIGTGLSYCAKAFAEHIEAGKLQGREVSVYGYSFGIDDARRQLSERSSSVLSQLLTTAVGAVLLLAFATLGLMESNALKSWLRTEWKGNARTATNILRRFSRDIRRYLVVRTGVGLLTGTMVTLGCWLLGIRLPLVWGIANFLLNYIPTVGSILGVLPPTVFTLIDTGSLSATVVAAATVGGVQLIMGNWVDPLLQGKYLEMSPSIVLLSVTFWGWLWGPWGAFVGVPITLFVARACEPFETTRPLSRLILRSEPERASSAEPDQPDSPRA